MRSPADRYRFSGEFHSFRIPRHDWSARRADVRDLGFEGVSIYVPWNWHMGARLLPIGIDLGAGRRLRHATAELLDRRTDALGSVALTFALDDGAIEVALDGPIGALSLSSGATLAAHEHPDGGAVLVIEAEGPEVTLRIAPVAR